MHADGSIDINFMTAYTGAGSYSGDSIPGTAYGQCSSLYCHSLGDTSVQSGQLDPAYGGSIYTNPDWGQGTPIGCNGCHGRTTVPGEPDYGGPDYFNAGQGLQNSNSHPAHLATGLNCSECHFMTTRDGVSINTADANGDTFEDGFVAHVNTVNTDVIFDPSRNPAASYTEGTKTCSNVSCHNNADIVWGGPPLNCLDCHNTSTQGRRNISVDFSITSHHILPGPPSRSQCLVCHDHSRHTQGNVRLVNADGGECTDQAFRDQTSCEGSGAVWNDGEAYLYYVYDPVNPSTAEKFCLSCHDSNGMAGNMVPFGDGRSLGVVPYIAGARIADDWIKGAVKGHRQSGLTCLGDGTPGTGCHATGHGSGSVGLLAKNMTLPLITTYDPLDFELCFDCHANETAPMARTKEEIFGVRFGGAYDGAYGPEQAPPGSGNNPPYNVPDIVTSFRDKNNQGKLDGEGLPVVWDDPENGNQLAKNLHWYHAYLVYPWWDYRGNGGDSNYWSSISCQACHDVHGTDSAYGMLHEEIGYDRTTDGEDVYGSIGNPNSLGDFPTGCAWNCHDTTMMVTSAWIGPAYDSKIVVSDASVSEDGGSIVFTVTTDTHSQNITVDYYTEDHGGGDAATADVDYQAIPQSSPLTLIFLQAENEKTISIPVYTDLLTEGSETFYLRLHYVSGDVTVSQTPATGTILDVPPP